MSVIELSIFPLIIAGIMNGSFVIPARYVQRLAHEKIWLFHSIIGLIIVPWTFLVILSPGVIHRYFQLGPQLLLFLIAGGVIFGFGQICFAKAIELIGIALAFTINLGLGVIIGSLFVAFNKDVFLTAQSYWVGLAVVLIMISLLLYYHSGKANNLHKNQNYYLGWFLAILAGFASGIQNIVFVILAFHTQTQFQHITSFWVWPPFLLVAAIPMIFNFLYKIHKVSKKVKAVSLAKDSLSVSNILLIPLMGVLFTGSLVLYSLGMDRLNHAQQVIGWPAFMVSIILTSQIWGMVQNSLQQASRRSKIYKVFSIIFLVGAILILSILG
jgi:L-rhamnose-H+ transport protein